MGSIFWTTVKSIIIINSHDAEFHDHGRAQHFILYTHLICIVVRLKTVVIDSVCVIVDLIELKNKYTEEAMDSSMCISIDKVY